MSKKESKPQLPKPNITITPNTNTAWDGEKGQSNSMPVFETPKPPPSKPKPEIKSTPKKDSKS